MERLPKGLACKPSAAHLSGQEPCPPPLLVPAFHQVSVPGFLPFCGLQRTCEHQHDHLMPSWCFWQQNYVWSAHGPCNGTLETGAVFLGWPSAASPGPIHGALSVLWALNKGGGLLFVMGDGWADGFSYCLLQLLPQSLGRRHHDQSWCPLPSLCGSSWECAAMSLFWNRVCKSFNLVPAEGVWLTQELDALGLIPP